MFRIFRQIALVFTALAASAATLQQLSMDDMTQGATAVVRARVVASAATAVGSGIYTRYRLSVSEVWKGTATAEVMLPGGDLNGRKESFPGVPELRVGGEYVLFLWKSPATGIVHTMGLTQGIFEVGSAADGSPTASRRQSGELMLDASGGRVSDQAISMKLTELKTRVKR